MFNPMYFFEFDILIEILIEILIAYHAWDPIKDEAHDPWIIIWICYDSLAKKHDNYLK